MTYIQPHMRECLKAHILEPLETGEKVQAFYLKKPGQGRAMSTLILFTPEGIVLQGDLTPGQNGNVSTIGYGLNWFRGELCGSYLCEKFLTKCYVPELVTDKLLAEILRQRREGELDQEKARECWDEVECEFEFDFSNPSDTYKFWTEELGNDDGDGCPGFGYRPGEAGWLCAIQERFAELYNAANPAQASV